MNIKKKWMLLAVFGLANSSFTMVSAAAPLIESYDFSSIWNLIQKNSSELSAVSHEREAAEISSSRAARHWFPSVYGSAKAYSTNDPATSFISTLGQRKIGVNDFQPSTLNEPSRGFYQQATLGVDLPLFEGGMKYSIALAASKMADAKSYGGQASRIELYSFAAVGYASLLAYIEERNQLKGLRQRVGEVVERYSVGSKSNPVGYSGLLGLRNLLNRIDGLLAASDAQTAAKQNELNAAAKELPVDFAVRSERVRDFLSKVFKSEKNDSMPLAALAASSGAEALEERKSAERARFLPKIGVFAQGDLSRGDRNTATSSTAGAYLQWELFSASNFGAISEATHTAAAARARADGLVAQLEARRIGALAGVAASERAITLLDESAQMLEEQTNTAKVLFRNGSLSALQLVEVLARRVDLIESRRDAELQLIASKAALFVSSPVRGI